MNPNGLSHQGRDKPAGIAIVLVPCNAFETLPGQDEGITRATHLDFWQ